MRSVLTIAFQFAYEVHTRETCAQMARQYVRTVVASVQRVAMALAPSRGAPQAQARQSSGNPDAITLARQILSSYRCAVFFFFSENLHVFGILCVVQSFIHFKLCRPTVGTSNSTKIQGRWSARKLSHDESQRLPFYVSQSDLRCKSYKQSKWRFSWYLKRSHRPPNCDAI